MKSDEKDCSIKISADGIIPDSKITRYLLVIREQDDKSKFLAQAGFTQDNPEQLISALRQLADAVEAVEDTTNEYGIFYRVEGSVLEIFSATGESIAVVIVPTSAIKPLRNDEILTVRPLAEVS